MDSRLDEGLVVVQVYVAAFGLKINLSPFCVNLSPFCVGSSICHLLGPHVGADKTE